MGMIVPSIRAFFQNSIYWLVCFLSLFLLVTSNGVSAKDPLPFFCKGKKCTEIPKPFSTDAASYSQPKKTFPYSDLINSLQGLQVGCFESQEGSSEIVFNPADLAPKSFAAFSQSQIAKAGKIYFVDVNTAKPKLKDVQIGWDSCKGEILTEHYCTQKVSSSGAYKTTGGSAKLDCTIYGATCNAKARRCELVKELFAPYCKDSDGDNIQNQGVVTAQSVFGGPIKTFVDLCGSDEKSVFEYTCNGETDMVITPSKPTPCLENYHCDTGACVPDTEPTSEPYCKEFPENDETAENKGIEYGDEMGVMTKLADQCLSQKSVWEMKCAGSLPKLIPPTEIPCEEGEICENGICIPDPGPLQPKSCTDLDPANDVYTNNKGATFNFGLGPQTLPDSCANDGTVKELICEGDKLSSTEIDCQEAEKCDNGLCIPENTCSDSDWDAKTQGLNYTDGGEVVSSASVKPVPDYCGKGDDENIVYEQYCENEIQKTKSFDCTSLKLSFGGNWSCKQDHCAQDFCVDSDQGLNSSKKGKVSIFSKSVIRFDDHCTNPKLVAEGICEKGWYKEVPLACEEDEVCQDGKCVLQECGNGSKSNIADLFTIPGEEIPALHSGIFSPGPFIRDVNNDQTADILFGKILKGVDGSDPKGTIEIYLAQNQEGNFEFVTPSEVKTGGGLSSLFVEDLNNDLLPDILTVSALPTDGPTLVTILSQGDDSPFAGVVPLTSFGHPDIAGIRDINHDGFLDIIYWKEFSGLVEVGFILGLGNGKFDTSFGFDPTSINEFAPLYFPKWEVVDDPSPDVSLAFGDLNHDGIDDIVLSRSCGNNAKYDKKKCSPYQINVVLSNDLGQYAEPFLLQEPNPPQGGFQIAAVELGDMNNDGELDIVVGGTAVDSDLQLSGLTEDTLWADIWLGVQNEGELNFSNPASYVKNLTLDPLYDEYFSSYTNFLHLADLNGDGYLDMAASLAGGTSVAGIALMISDGAAMNFGAGWQMIPQSSNCTGTGDFDLGDLNSDHCPDMVYLPGCYNDMPMLIYLSKP